MVHVTNQHVIYHAARKYTVQWTLFSPASLASQDGTTRDPENAVISSTFLNSKCTVLFNHDFHILSPSSIFKPLAFSFCRLTRHDPNHYARSQHFQNQFRGLIKPSSGRASPPTVHHGLFDHGSQEIWRSETFLQVRQIKDWCKCDREFGKI